MSFIHETAAIGDNAIVAPSAYIGANVTIGDDCYIGPGACLGQRGFGYQPDHQGEWEFRDHPYGVVIGDRVSIGANTVIDRGRYRDTTIGAGTKIDAHVFIAHNVQVGRRCLIIANSMIAGSCEIADDCWVGPAAQLTDHVKVGHHARIGLGSVVLGDVPAGQLWVGNPARYLRDTIN